MPDLTTPIEKTEEIQDLSAADKKNIAVTALEHLSAADQADVTERAGLGSPGRETTDMIWLCVVGTFCVALLAAVLALAWSVIRGIDGGPLLTVFTTVTAFLAGLLSPSPGATLRRNGNGG